MEGSTSEASKVKGGKNVVSKQEAAAGAKGSGKSEGEAVPKALTKSNLKQLRKTVPQADIDLINPAKVKKGLNQHVKSLAQAVNRDWHDSWEETGEELCRYMGECLDIVEMSLNTVIENGVAFDWCNQVLVTIADTWDNIEAIPFRCPPDERLDPDRTYLTIIFIETDEGTVTRNFKAPLHIHKLLQIAWPILLAAAADPELKPDVIGDEELLQMIKDAVDNGVEPLEITPDANGDDDYIEYIELGYDRICKLHSKTSAWKSLPSSKRFHAMRKGIDRRFDGPKHLRTRNYEDDDFW